MSMSHSWRLLDSVPKSSSTHSFKVIFSKLTSTFALVDEWNIKFINNLTTYFQGSHAKIHSELLLMKYVWKKWTSFFFVSIIIQNKCVKSFRRENSTIFINFLRIHYPGFFWQFICHVKTNFAFWLAVLFVEQGNRHGSF